MEKFSLNAEVRKSLGTGAANRYRRQGQVPGIIYGHGDPVSVVVGARELHKALHTHAGTNVVITLQMAGANEETVIVRDLQRHPLSRNYMHIDFFRIKLTEKIETKVHIEILGVAPAIKAGGILIEMTREVEIRALPLEIPDSIKVDISKLEKIGDSIHVSSLALPAGVEMVTPGDVTIVSIAAPQAEEAAPAPTEAAVAGAAAEPEVVGKGKDEKAEGAEGAAAKPEKGKDEKK